VSLIGGEVFMRRDWREIVYSMTSRGISVNIITNGFLFTESILQDLKKLKVESVAVSVDGPREVHDKYRQQGSYDRAFRAIEALTGAGIPTSVISTLNSENVRYLEEFYETLKKYPIFAWQIQACSPMGNAANGGVDVAFDPRRVIHFIEDNARTAPFAMGIADNIGYFTPSEGWLRGNLSGRAYFKGCSAGISAIGIDSVGNVRGCESMYDERFNEGNLRERSLKDIWEDPDGFSYNRKFTKELLTGACARCELGEYCAGGCRSYNWFNHGKLYESPRCARALSEAENLPDAQN
jgi:radical SAM protein with 4Fe4S-binding SPASM domain